jgi:hypothetical protein
VIDKYANSGLVVVVGLEVFAPPRLADNRKEAKPMIAKIEPMASSAFLRLCLREKRLLRKLGEIKDMRLL